MLQEHQKPINDETNEITMITGKSFKDRKETVSLILSSHS